MGMIFRKKYTMLLPGSAEITERNGNRVAHWRLRNGKHRSAEVVDCKDGKIRVRGKSRLYMARYRGADGEMIEVATGCRDEVAARAVLTRLERNVELVRAGIMTPARSSTYASTSRVRPGKGSQLRERTRASTASETPSTLR